MVKNQKKIQKKIQKKNPVQKKKVDKESLVQSIKVSTGMTLNLGNYESLRVDAGIEVMKHPDIPVVELYDYAWEQVQNEVKAKIKAVKKKLKK